MDFDHRFSSLRGEYREWLRSNELEPGEVPEPPRDAEPVEQQRMRPVPRPLVRLGDFLPPYRKAS
jgi:hypothetical protein